MVYIPSLNTWCMQGGCSTSSNTINMLLLLMVWYLQGWYPHRVITPGWVLHGMHIMLDTLLITYHYYHYMIYMVVHPSLYPCVYGMYVVLHVVVCVVVCICISSMHSTCVTSYPSTPPHHHDVGVAWWVGIHTAMHIHGIMCTSCSWYTSHDIHVTTSSLYPCVYGIMMYTC